MSVEVFVSGPLVHPFEAVCRIRRNFFGHFGNRKWRDRLPRGLPYYLIA